MKDEAMTGRLPSIKWTHDPEFWSAEQAEHAIVGNYELVALNLQPTAQFPTRDIGWELFGPPERQTQLATGKCATFEEAKAAAEAALAALLNPHWLRSVKIAVTPDHGSKPVTSEAVGNPPESGDYLVY